jgi:four helix bundle protein
MAKILNFEDLEIWKTSRIVTKQAYLDFSHNRDFGYKDQIQRASISIMNNIAEGFRRSGDREKINFFNFAIGSANEVKNMYYVAEDINYLSPELCMERRNHIQGLMNGIAAFMNYLRNNPRPKK